MAIYCSQSLFLWLFQSLNYIFKNIVTYPKLREYAPGGHPNKVFPLSTSAPYCSVGNRISRSAATLRSAGSVDSKGSDLGITLRRPSPPHFPTRPRADSASELSWFWRRFLSAFFFYHVWAWRPSCWIGRTIWTRHVDMANPHADGYFSDEPGTKVQWRWNVQRQIPVENKSAKFMCCNSVCMQGSVTAILVNWFASWW